MDNPWLTVEMLLTLEAGKMFSRRRAPASSSSHRTWELKICDATRPGSDESRFAPCSS